MQKSAQSWFVLEKTYIFNTITDKWSPGPPINEKRIDCGCGRIRKSNMGNEKVYIVVGGHVDNDKSVMSVDLLDDVYGQWYLGKTLALIL